MSGPEHHRELESYNDDMRERQNRTLKCQGIGRDKDCISALQFYFNRRVTNDEMRFLHEVIQRAVCMFG